MIYTLLEFAKSLQLERCKIQNTPRVLFLCGGERADTGPVQSARDHFYRQLLRGEPDLKARVVLAEQISDWFHKDNSFPDLLELENYLAHLSDLILLFVESAGSIAELGAFSASNVLGPKTLVVLNNFYKTERTFIADGPVRRILNRDPNFVRSYEWDPATLSAPNTLTELGEMTEELVGILKARDGEATKQQVFDFKRVDHVLLLIADLVRIGGAVSRSDLSNALEALGIKQDHPTLDQQLSILQSVKLIQRKRRSNQFFFLRISGEAFVRYGYRDDAAEKDIARVQALIRQSLDSIRAGVLRNALAGAK